MKKAIGVVALFLAVFVLGLLWSFPLDAVALRMVRDVEVRNHLRIQWASARWSLWRSTLGGVVVKNANGQVLVEFQTVEVRPRWARIDVDARASWGSLTARVTGERIEGDLAGYPLSLLAPDLPLADARLGAHFTYLPQRSLFQGDLTLSGDLRAALYQGPLALQGTLRMEGRGGTLERLDVTGTALSGRADVISIALPADGFENLRVSGAMRLVLNGNTLWVNVTGQGRAITAMPTAAPGTPSGGGAPMSPPPVPPMLPRRGTAVPTMRQGPR